VFKRGLLGSAPMSIGFDVDFAGMSVQRSESDPNKEANIKMDVHYLEIVSNDVDTRTTLYQARSLVWSARPRSRAGPCGDSNGRKSAGDPEALGGA